VTPLRPVRPIRLWPLLALTQRKDLLALLSDLLARRLPGTAREADDEQS
jgi:hypothetical protein